MDTGGLKFTLETLGRLGIVGLAEQGVAMGAGDLTYAAFARFAEYDRLHPCKLVCSLSRLGDSEGREP